MVVVAQLAVAAALIGFGWWGRGVTADRIHMVGPDDERERRALACRRGAVACLTCGLLVAAATVVTLSQVMTAARTG